MKEIGEFCSIKTQQFLLTRWEEMKKKGGKVKKKVLDRKATWLKNLPQKKKITEEKI